MSQNIYSTNMLIGIQVGSLKTDPSCKPIGLDQFDLVPMFLGLVYGSKKCKSNFFGSMLFLVVALAESNRTIC